MNENQQPPSSAFLSLENLRTRLLDLTARNRLLNFRHGRTGNLRIIDEQPDHLHELLLSEEELRFLSVPEPKKEQLIEAGYIDVDEEEKEEKENEQNLLYSDDEEEKPSVQKKKKPTAQEWARWLGFQTSYELPEPGLIDSSETDSLPQKHRDKAIQVLLFPYELETRLRDLRAKAATAIEETGANILYLAFGFLEWFEGPDSDKSRIAPLLLVPVRLTKGRLNRKTGTYEYTISYSGEDIVPNLSLQEKLRVDFNLALPDLDENTKPEKYFSEVSRLVESNQPRWQVRRYATVALLNFSKLLMYLDMDPIRWPKDNQITEHPIIRRFFEIRVDSDSEIDHFDSEYNIDELPEVHKHYPLVEDADSSQHSALVDALNGEDLVIEGPPGTGKSQTITNLIAAALVQGKRILFVAEKLAALEVVKRRLDNAGLGDFCLELHSHKTQKSKVLDDIKSRLENQGNYPHPLEIDADIARFESLKKELKDYAEKINSHWKGTGKSIHDILAGATCYRQQLKIDPIELHPEGIDIEQFTPHAWRQSRDLINSYGHVYSAVAVQFSDSHDPSSHPWHGVNNHDLQLFDTDRVCEVLKGWQESLEKLKKSILEAQPLFSNNNKADIPGTLTGIEQLTTDLALLKPLHGDEHLHALPWLKGENLNTFQQHLKLFQEIQDLFKSLEQDVSHSFLEELSLLETVKNSYKLFQEIGISQETRLSTLAKIIGRIDVLQGQLQQINKRMEQIAGFLGPAFEKAMGMHDKGLREFRKFINLTVELKPNLWKLRDKRFDDEELDEALPRLHSRITELIRQRDSFSQTFDMHQVVSSEELEEIQIHLTDAGWLCWCKGPWWGARKKLRGLAAQPELKIKVLRSELSGLIQFVKDKEALEGDKQFRQLLGEHFQGLDTDSENLLALRSWYGKVRQSYGIGFGPHVALGQTLIDMPNQAARGMRSLVEQGFLELLDKSLAELLRFITAFPQLKSLHHGTEPLIGEQGVLTLLKNKLTRSVEPCQTFFIKSDLTIKKIETLLHDLTRLQAKVKKWEENKSDHQWFGNTLELSIGCGQDNEQALAAAVHTASLASLIDQEITTPALKEAMYSKPEKERFEALAAFGQELQKVWAEQKRTLQVFTELTALDFSSWIQRCGDKVTKVIERNDWAIYNRAWLTNWLDFIRTRQGVVAQGFERLAHAVEKNLIGVQALEAGYNLGMYDLFSREILRELPELTQFSGEVHETVQQQFCEYDEKLKQLQQQRIASQVDHIKVPTGSRGGKVSTYTDLSLLRHECAKKRRHIPIRQLVRRARNALAALKPCFMMGPMSVAQYLAPGEFDFDLVVMDEASQMKPEDALGSVARGQQLVVVGDPKQLPPTNFFEKLIDFDEDEATALEESESILDAVMPLFKVRRLSWHYRSQHESLIAFSNHFFYDKKLVLFPSPNNDSRVYGVQFELVKEGKFVNRRNTEEARVIAEAVREHFLHRPEESLGIVAMNVEQRDHIERAVERLAKEDESFQATMENEQGKIEPLFIKNLENVQGDERDVMFISMTYGPQERGGPVMQRFGPINTDVGWRRLNVLFTRARKGMRIFSSMTSDSIVVQSNPKRGVRALKDFLAYAETGILHEMGENTHRAPDSDFEIAVAEELKNAGFDCVCQVGVAGFFIDIAVSDPNNPGLFLMGIECDGASYHSAKSVRDRDRLRQTVLERLGWRIRRIWSTDWYKNPQAQLQPIIRELNVLKND